MKPYLSIDWLVFCQRCGLAQQTPLPSLEELENLYEQSYYDSWGEEAEYIKIKRALCSEILRLSGDFRKQRARVLDVGCATGSFLDVIRSKGWEAWGIDVNPYAIAASKKKVPDAKVLKTTLEEAPIETGSFDFMIFSDVLEHATNPYADLKKAQSLLKEDGRIAILTPDLGSISARVMGKKWPHIKREHLFYFSRQSITDMLQKAGFVGLRISKFRKPMTLEYAIKQFKSYPLFIMTQFFNMLEAVIPKPVRGRLFYAPMGEMLISGIKVK